MSQRRPNTDVTGDVAAPGLTQSGVHPLIERICQSIPGVMDTVLPTLWSHPLNTNASVNSPVVLLYVIPPRAERDVRSSLFENVFQSADERAPILVLLARARESCCPERVRPFGVPSVRASWDTAERAAREPERVARGPASAVCARALVK